MPDIVLATLNAKYQHSAFGLRYLLANLGPLRPRTQLVEFTINQRTLDVVDLLVDMAPRILGFGVYIWNVDQTTRIVSDLKQLLPDTTIVIGGPEVSFPDDPPELMQSADYVITGEADLAFRKLCEQLLADSPPTERLIRADLPQLGALELPYAEYNAEDLAHRVIYVEASRGCPFTCEFCLSALDIPVRQFPLDEFLQAMQSLLDRGALQFKFVDRTFNLNLKTSAAILRFFLDRFRPGMFLHFEMIPDRLPESLRSLIAEFPPGSLQFEVGVQTLNAEIGGLIQRKQDVDRLRDNLEFLRVHTGVHVHADLIVGLPEESWESWARGFDELLAMRPQEIQVGMLKRLRGSPITRHDQSSQMVYSRHAPYEVLSTSQLSAPLVARLRRFARYWDSVFNSGNFVETVELLWQEASAGTTFLRFSDWLHEREGRAYGIALVRLAERLFEFLVDVLGQDEQSVAATVWRDYCRGGRTDRPTFLRRFDLPAANRHQIEHDGRRRQMRHVGLHD